MGDTGYNLRLASERIYALEGLRAISALAVVALHLQSSLGTSFAPPSAYLAVDLFFIVSGYVIAHSYDERIGQGLSFGSFMKLRIIRLYPLYAFSLAIGVAYLLIKPVYGGVGADTEFRSIIYIILVTPNAIILPAVSDFNGLLFPSNFPAWSLLFELFAYAIYHISYKLLLNSRKLCVLLFVFGFLIFVLFLIYGSLDVGALWSGAPLGASRVIFGFFVGVAISRLRNSRKWRISPAVILGLALATFYLPTTLWDICDPVVVVAVYPILILVTSRLEATKGWEAATLYYTGSISYALYITHYPAIRILGIFLEHKNSAWNFWLYFLLTIMFAFVAQNLFERPIRKALLFVIGHFDSRRAR